MFTRTLILKLLALTALTALAACGGGSGSGNQGSGANQYVPNSQLFMASNPNVTLDVLRLDPATGMIKPETTNLTTPGTLTGGTLAGTISYSTQAGAQNAIDLNGGGQAILADQGNQYAFRFGASGGRIGVAGIPATNMPTTGSAAYTGFADVNVNDGSGSPKSLTSLSAIATFNTGKVNVYLSNASDWIRINGANISGNGYSGGIMTVSPTFATDPVTSGALKHEGRFFETDAKEIGGVFILDRTDAGVNFKAEGAYSGNDGS